MSWEQLAEKGYNTYMMCLSGGSWKGNFFLLHKETQLAWVEATKSIYDHASESARDALVKHVCEGGL
jgi:hypothetical protein